MSKKKSPIVGMVLGMLPVVELMLRSSGVPEVPGKVDVYEAIQILKDALTTLQSR